MRSLSVEHELTLLVLVTALARAYNILDTSRLEQLLDEDSVYESQHVITPLRGRQNILEYLSRKFETIRNTPGSRLFAEVAYLGSQHQATIQTTFAVEGQPCVILSQGERENKFALIFIEAIRGKIARVDICTVAPHWSQAEGTGEYPE